MSDPTAGMLESLRAVDPIDFEHFIADLWEHRGWRTEVTQGSRDAGIDIIARRSDPFEQTHVIQAKRYASGNRVSSSEIQQYASLRRQVSEADSVIVVSTSDFTADAEDRAEELNVKLVGGTTLLAIIEEADAYELIEEYSESANADSPSSRPVGEEEAIGSDATAVEETDESGVEEEMTTAEAVSAVVQGLVALAIIGLMLFFIAQVLFL